MKYFIFLFVCLIQPTCYAQIIIDNGNLSGQDVRYDEALPEGVILYEGFENAQRPGLPQGWTSQSLASSGFYSGTAGKSAGQSNENGFWNVPEHGIFAMTNDDVCNCDKSKDRLVSPVIDLSGYEEASIQFTAFQNGSSGQSASLQIIANGRDWTTILDIPAGVEWQRFMVAVPSNFLHPGFKLRFQYDDHGNYASGLAIDDVYITDRMEDRIAMSKFYALHADDVGSGQFHHHIPIKQARHAEFQFGAKVENTFPEAKEAKLHVNISGPIDFQDSSAHYLIAQQNIDHIKLLRQQSFTPYALGHYTLYAETKTDTSDHNQDDNIYATWFNVVDSTYAPVDMLSENTVGVWLRESIERYGVVFHIHKSDSAVALKLHIHPSSEPPARFKVKIFPFDTLNFSVYSSTTIELSASDIGQLKRIPLDYEFSRGKYVVAIEKELSPGRLVISASRSQHASDSNALTKKSGALWRPFAYFPQMELIMPMPDNNCKGHLQAIITNESCPLSADGAISAQLIGDSGLVTYDWSNNLGGNPSVSNLTSGLYTLSATDASGCLYERRFVVEEPDILQIQPQYTLDSCARGEGEIDLNLTGGNSPYSILWNGNTGMEYEDSLSQGTYTVSIVDALGCEMDTTLQLGGTDSLNVAINAILPGCGASDGEIYTTSSGTAPFDYTWNNGSTLSNQTNISSGIYTTTISDSISCKIVKTIILHDSGAAELDVTSTESIICGGDSTGSVEVSVSLGASPYSYLWSNGDITKDLTNASEGAYFLTTTDANNCRSYLIAEVSSQFKPLQLVFNAQGNYCFNGTSGIAEALVSGGLEPYAYAWSNSSSNQRIENLAPGTYSLTSTDSNGCVISDNITISEGIPLFVQLDSVYWDTSSNFIDDSKVYVTAYGGTTPYDYLWNDSIESQDLMNVPPDTYELLITDQLGCKAKLTYILENGPVGVKSSSLSLKESIVFPNPVKIGNAIRVKHIPSGTTLSLYDASGKEVFPSATEHFISTDSLLPGIYFIRIEFKEDFWIQRIVIIR